MSNIYVTPQFCLASRRSASHGSRSDKHGFVRRVAKVAKVAWFTGGQGPVINIVICIFIIS